MGKHFAVLPPKTATLSRSVSLESYSKAALSCPKGLQNNGHITPVGMGGQIWIGRQTPLPTAPFHKLYENSSWAFRVSHLPSITRALSSILLQLP